MKAVRKSARLTSTVLGGVPCVPMALRMIERTTTMRVKEVTITRMEGASVITVRTMMSWKTRPVSEAESPRSSVSC